MNNITIEHIATQKINNDGSINYNYRDMESTASFIKSMSNRFSGRKPIYSIWYGIEDNTPDGFIKRLDYLAEIYNRTSGIRLRSVFVDIKKEVLKGIDLYNAIIKIACSYAEYYLYQGYLTGLIIYDLGEYFRCYYFINPVSYWDGGKYRPNYNDCLDKEYYVLETIKNRVISRYKGDLFDYRGLVAYPLI